MVTLSILSTIATASLLLTACQREPAPTPIPRPIPIPTPMPVPTPMPTPVPTPSPPVTIVEQRTIAELGIEITLPFRASVEVGFTACSLPRTGDAELLRGFETTAPEARISLRSRALIVLRQRAAKGCVTDVPPNVLSSIKTSPTDTVDCVAAAGADAALAASACKTMKRS
jgi:hypothetical protein